MTKLTYADAVKMAAAFIHENRYLDGEDQFCQIVADRKSAAKVGNYFADIHIHSQFQRSVLVKDVANTKSDDPDDYPEDYLIQKAKHQWLAFNALTQSLASKMEKGEHISPLFRDWIVSYLRGDIELPNKPDGNKNKNAGNHLVRGAIYLLRDHGWSPSHNPAKPKPCGCSAVAEAMQQLGLTPNTYDSVLRVWKRRIEIPE